MGLNRALDGGLDQYLVGESGGVQRAAHAVDHVAELVRVEGLVAVQVQALEAPPEEGQGGLRVSITQRERDGGERRGRETGERDGRERWEREMGERKTGKSGC